MQDRCHKSCIFYSSGECIVEKYELPEIISQDLNFQDTRPGRKCVHPEIFSLEGIGNLPTEEEIDCEIHGKQTIMVFGENNDAIKCPKCFNEYWKKRYFV